jgi:hypothetical protein
MLSNGITFWGAGKGCPCLVLRSCIAGLGECTVLRRRGHRTNRWCSRQGQVRGVSDRFKSLSGLELSEDACGS